MQIVYSRKNLYVEIFIASILGLLLGLISLLSSPLVALLFLLGIISAIILIKHPEVGIIGYIVATSTIYNFQDLPPVHIGIGTIYLTDFLLFGFLAIVLIQALLIKKEKSIYSSITLPVLLFIGFALISTTLGILQSNLTFNDALGPVRTILNYLTFFIVFYLCWRKDQLKKIFSGIIIAATIVAAIMIIQFVVGPSIRLLAGRVEILSTEGMSDPGATRIIPPGYPLITVAFISLTVSFFLKNFQRIQIAKLLQWVLIGIGVLITYKRHIWGVVALSVLIMLFLVTWKNKAKFIFISQILILMIVTTSYLVVQFEPKSKPAILVNSFLIRTDSLFQSGTYEANSSLRWRDFEYQYAIPQIIAHPLLGLGLGAIYRPFVPYRDNANFDGQRFIHNGHVALMVKTGLLGYLSFFWVAVIFLYRGFKNWRSVTDPSLQIIVIGFTLSFLGLFLGSIIEPMIVEWDCTSLIGIMMGINEAILIYHSNE